MQDTSLRDEIDAEKHSHKKAIRQFIIIIMVLAVAVAGAGASAMQKQQKRAELTKQANATGEPQAKPVFVYKHEVRTGHSTVQAEELEQESATATLPDQAQPVNPAPSKDETKMDPVNVQLCQEIIADAVKMNNYNISQYMNTWKFWRENFRGIHESPEAQESKKWYHEHFQQRYAEILRSTEANLREICGSDYLIKDVLIQPDYDQWR